MEEVDKGYAAYLGSPGQRAVKRLCVSVCVCMQGGIIRTYLCLVPRRYFARTAPKVAF